MEINPAILANKVSSTLSPPITLTRHSTIEGDDHLIYFIAEHTSYILRVTKPRKDRGYDGAEMQMREKAIREVVRAGYESRGLPAEFIPQCVYSFPVSEDGVHVASLERKLHGVSLDDVKDIKEKTKQEFIDLLTVLKNVDISGIISIGVKVPDVEMPELNTLHRNAVHAWRRMIHEGGLEGVIDAGEEDAESLFERKTAFIDQIQGIKEADSVLVHNDLKGEHVLVNKDTGKFTAVLDWADVGLGNPAIDIAGMVLTIGTQAAQEVAVAVGYSRETILQGIILGRSGCVMRLDERLRGIDTMSPQWLLRAQLKLSLE
ncbi:hypothetical protein EYZ11_007794 [Aspergillus tanneri]|uniref:Aminoglycoside phosphotransferase domain-containing protein n=1 Tax=Aspergillus tanneri TaxID=1220188 RepID=A0A4S3JE99_9EURO|nr:uncharacterized protein ATNIH1004_009632 [Aspergillus tanneri]KAA8642876.1 hypothetical protein ATNIH1004_009632 [Aspergillus tanneri]THC92717.1 hypothetical protein EYZ11_007794 [Aspergillus tanneri]